MLVATPGQTAAYTTTLHNSNNSSSSGGNSGGNGNGGGGGSGNNGTAAAAATVKKSTNATVSGTSKSLSNNNNHTASSSVINKNSINSNTHTTTTNNTTASSYTYHQNTKNNQNKILTATSSREIISSTVTAKSAATVASTTTTNSHSLKTENSTNTNNTTNTTATTTKQQSFIQTLKDSVQKALISTTGGNNSIVHKLTAENKLQNNCNNSSTSIQNVTSSSSSTTSHNANKVSTTTTNTNTNTSTSNNSGNSAAATQSSSSTSASVVRGKYFSCSLSKLHTVAPTIIHRYPEERQHASSTDSLQKEMCHFKPIRIVPTTPWKSGSKSRGNSLRFPKANLATKNTEFVLKSNCDVNNRKKKQQPNRTQNDKIINVKKSDETDVNEQENKEFYGIYKPKPSLTCLSTSVTTPNHQSAFVCLVSQMKSLVNLQSKNQNSPFMSSAVIEDINNEPIKELYVRKKSTKKSLEMEIAETELTKSRPTRLTSNAVKNKRVTNVAKTANNLKENVKRNNAKSTNISKSAAAITKAKSRRKVGGSAKTKTVNMVTLAKSKGKLQNSISMPAVVNTKIKATSAATRRTRKRKIIHNDNNEEDEVQEESTLSTEIATVKSLVPIARKSSRLSKDMSSNKLFKYPTNQNSQQTTLKPTTTATTQNKRKNSKTFVCFSPPLTRSRLKHLAEQEDLLTN
ncbi:uncharacterized protein ACRADG_013110 isoform 2-T3 [Cochliomyia hominivorax]